MMEDLLVINDVTFPEMEGAYEIDYTDKKNDYESESGESTVEIIRENICIINVKYNGLLEAKLRELMNAVSVVNTVKFYDPRTGKVETKTMKTGDSRMKTSKKYYRDGLSVWSLSFNLEEM